MTHTAKPDLSIMPVADLTIEPVAAELGLRPVTVRKEARGCKEARG